MELAEISIIFPSWHGNGDIDLDGTIDDHEKKANHRVIKAMLDYIRDNDKPFKVAILVEPYFGNGRTAESLTVDDKRDILDLLWEEFYEPHWDITFRWRRNEDDSDAKPLVIPWASVDLKEAGDSRFTVKNWSSTDYPDWREPGNLDWNCTRTLPWRRTFCPTTEYSWCSHDSTSLGRLPLVRP